MANLIDKLQGRTLIENASDEEIELINSMLNGMIRIRPEWMSSSRWAEIFDAVKEAKANPINVGTPTSKRESTLVEAECIVNGERAVDYGDSTTNLTRIAGIAELLLDDSEWEHLASKREFSATMIAKVMIAVKLGRERHQHKRDNLVDAAGYIELLDRCYQ